jgi:hypothetical protein
MELWLGNSRERERERREKRRGWWGEALTSGLGIEKLVPIQHGVPLHALSARPNASLGIGFVWVSLLGPIVEMLLFPL